MDQHTLTEVLDCLGSERRLFWYFPGRFAFALLAEAAAQNQSVRALKNQPEGRFLAREDVRSVVSRCGNGALTPEVFSSYWDERAIPFTLSLDRWGSDRDCEWQQTSRRGHNLVLRLDFAMDHMGEIQRRFGRYEWLFNAYGHPVAHRADRKRETLAWARLDLDFDCNEVLIEEIQSDWARDVVWASKHGWRTKSVVISRQQARSYLQEALRPIIAIWSEAMLLATLWFVREELGIQRVYYHEFATGCALKRVRYGRPPKSLYSDLPRRFCMQLVEEAPEFLQTDRRARRVLKKMRPHRFYLRETSPAHEPHAP